MTASTKKELKAEAKRAKKAAKLEKKLGPPPASTGIPAKPSPPSPAVRYAEFVRGVLSIVLGASIVGALIAGQRGVIMSLDDIINSLFAARAGKVLLALIAIGLVIYGLKYLRLVR